MLRVSKPFEYFEPRTVEEACSLLQKYKGKAKLLAGGTDLLINLKEKKITPQYIIGINSIKNLDNIAYSDGKGLKIGTLATHQSIADSLIIKERFNFLGTACFKVGTPQVRNMGTIGGNVCMAGPSQDTPPVLLSLDAKLKLVSPKGERIAPIDEFFVGPFKTVLSDVEILTEIQIPNPPQPSEGCYQWLTKITGADETLVGIAVLLVLDPKDWICNDIRIGLTSVAPTPMRAKRAESMLRGKKMEDALIEEVAKMAADETRPRSRPDYRRKMTAVLTKRAINEAWLNLRRKSS